MRFSPWAVSEFAAQQGGFLVVAAFEVGQLGGEGGDHAGWVVSGQAVLARLLPWRALPRG